MPFLTTLFEPQKKHFFYHLNEFLYKDMYFSALQRFHPTFCPPCPKTQFYISLLNVGFLQQHILIKFLKTILDVHLRFIGNSCLTNGSYLTTSRGFCLGCRRQDVYNSRTCYCLRHGGECGVWNNLLDNHVVLIVGRGCIKCPESGKGNGTEIRCRCCFIHNEMLLRK